PFEVALRGATAMSDFRVLHALAEEMGVELGLPTVAAARAELSRLLGARPDDVPPMHGGNGLPLAPAARVDSGQATLAMWSDLLDAGRLQDGEAALAATAKPLRAVVSAGTAAVAGLTAGAAVTVTGPGGSITAPVSIAADMVDGAVWLPANVRGASVRAALRAEPGEIVVLRPIGRAEGIDAVDGPSGDAREGRA
ncbi:MAG: NADH-quinone oxidoreductase subunit G, partial [Frankiaceae bacterium]|nr:NADH-quinone oxidoreductase subunit G [Frankiaceae bacterium]